MSVNLILKWKKLHPSAQIPKLATEGAAAFDFTAAMDQDIEMHTGEIFAIPTGLSVEIPRGYELQVRARSGLALKHGFALVNGVGTIDSDYRGEIKIIATLLSRHPLLVRAGDRVAQGLVATLVPVEHVESMELSETSRGAGGFGSTGVESIP